MKPDGNILAIDTSTRMGGISIVQSGRGLIELNWIREKSHTETVTAAIEEVLNQTGLQLGEIAAISIGKGPGSFTGIRIGINIAKTLSYAMNLPLYAFDTPFLLASSVRNYEGPIIAAINAFKNQVYYSLFEKRADSLQLIKGPAAKNLGEICDQLDQPHLIVGDGFDAYSEGLSEEQRAKITRDHLQSDFPLASQLGLLCYQFPDSTIDWKDLQPLYIRASEAEEKLKAGLLKPLPKI